MADSSDILWNLYKQHCEWERHHDEEQRASGTGLLIGVAAGVLIDFSFGESSIIDK